MMNEQTAPVAELSSADVVARRLRDEIRTGTLKPSEKLQLRSLCQRYGVSTSPIREALSRLASEGLVTAESQRGFWVAAASSEDLLDILRFRKVIEGEALRMSMADAGEPWEIGIVTAFHRVNKHAAKAEHGSAWVDEYEVLHKAFHMSLIAGCGSRRMQEACARLYDETERYRRLYWSYEISRNEVIAEHRQLMDIVLARDADLAVTAHRKHLDLTLEMAARLPGIDTPALAQRQTPPLAARQTPALAPQQTPALTPQQTPPLPAQGTPAQTPQGAIS